MSQSASQGPSSSVFQLSDGRDLGYIDFRANGTSKANIQLTCLYFHGFPGSRIEGGIAAADANARDVRFISLDRPGMGFSTFQPNRKFLDWPKDVLELVDHLGIDTFYIAGASGGSPYVLACVKLIPHTRLLGAVILAGVYPFKYGMEDMPMGLRMFMWASASWWLRPVVPWALEWALGSYSRNPNSSEKMEQMFMKDMSTKPEVDRRCLDDLVLRKRIVDSLKEAFRKDSYGVAWEAKLYAGDWGFELEDVSHENLIMWHGKLDSLCSVRLAEKAASVLKGAQFKIYEDEAHLSMSANHLPELFDALLNRRNTT